MPHVVSSQNLLAALDSIDRQTGYNDLVLELRRSINAMLPNRGIGVFESDSQTGEVLSTSRSDHHLAEAFSPRLDLLNKLSVDHPIAQVLPFNESTSHEHVLNDVIGLDEYRKSEFYRTFMRPLGVDNFMMAQLFIGAYRACWIAIYRRGDSFRPGERAIFRQLIGSARAAALTISSRAYDAALVTEFCAHTDKDETLPLAFIAPNSDQPSLNPQGKHCLEQEFGASKDFTPLFQKMTRLFEAHAKFAWNTPLTPRWIETALNCCNRTTVLRCLPCRDGGGAIHMMPAKRGVGEENVLIGAKSKRLTKRQSIVLHWVSQGKTNDEVATILGLSKRTVEKHLQNVFQALGVENRMSAAVEYMRFSN